jgi:CPA2 family monovalent cation:H+ antiporter-2
MHHDTPLISTIVAGLVLAFIFGAIANRFRMPPLVGYLVAGVVVGPFTPGFVADGELATELSELGVILLMFGVGLHFSLKDLLSVRAVAVPGAIVQIAGATALGCGLGLLLGWGIGAGLIFGLALSVASTVVLLKALQDRRLIESEKGKIAVGWLIVEDMAMVLALVLIPAVASLAGGSGEQIVDPFVNFTERMFNIELGIPGVLAVTVIKLAAFVGFMLVVGRRVIPYILHFTAHTGSRELFRLAVLAIALGVAAGAAYLFGVSLALGAFFAGMILSESELSHRAAQESLPLRDAFAVLFFVSVGMLFDPSILVTNTLPLLATVFIILIGKSIFAFLIVLAFRQPIGTALVISASLAQIGEFSFILATLGVSLDILPAQAKDLILGGAILSIVLNPVIFWAVEKARPGLERRFPGKVTAPRVEPAVAASAPKPEPAAALAEEVEVAPHPTALSNHTILIGYGRVGTVVGEGLLASHAPFLVIEDAEGRINAARASGIEVIVGNAASPKVLGLANVAGAKTCVIAIPNAFEAGQAVEQCRKQNAGLVIIARSHSDEEEQHLLHLGANTVIMGEREIGLGMLELVQRDSSAVAEVVASDAVAAALGTSVTVPRAPVVAEPVAIPAETLADGPITEPEASDADDAIAVAAVTEPVPDAETLLEEIEAAPVQHADTGPAEPPAVVSAYGEEPDPKPETPVAAPDSLPFKARQPARTPATPFNPEVAPAGPVEK